MNTCEHQPRSLQSLQKPIINTELSNSLPLTLSFSFFLLFFCSNFFLPSIFSNLRKLYTQVTIQINKTGVVVIKAEMGGPGSSSPCASCKLLRRRCAKDCIFAPYFPPDDPHKFAIVHKVFGASNVSKMLQVSFSPQLHYIQYVFGQVSNFLHPFSKKKTCASMIYISNNPYSL